jgi:N-acyl-D-aspartate/D-glutamate deacylase
MFDLIIRGGKIVDGTGRPAYHGDVAVKDGRIAAVGNVDGTAEREIDAGGHVVCPGFVDVHTHYDAQVFWDPALSPSCFHGVTTVVGGNCGFSIAPLSPESGAYLLPMLARVEGIPVETLKEGVPWNWSSFGDYLGKLDGKVGLNIGFMAGHSAIRRLVMGERANGETASPADLDNMVAVLDRSLSEGALGLSSTRSSSHNDATGNPVPSRYATTEECVTLARVCGKHEGTSLEMLPSGGDLSQEEADLFINMSLAAGRTINWNAMTAAASPDWVAKRLALADRARASGAEVIALTTPMPATTQINMFSGFIFDSFDGWAPLFRMSVPDRIEAMRDRALRKELDRRGRSEATGFIRFMAEVENLTILDSAQPGVVGRTVGDIATERGVEPIDAMFDIAIADGLKTSFCPPKAGDDEVSWQRRKAMWTDPRTVVGASDAGAHLDMIDQFAFTTALLGEGMRLRKLISLEEAVRQLTQVPAGLLGLRERGVLREGWHADIVVFDPDTVAMGEVYSRNDLPGGQMRIYADAIGIDHVIVNGTPIVENGEHTGDLPGAVLRSGRDTATRVMPHLMSAE